MQTIMIMMAVLSRRAVFAVMFTPDWDNLGFESNARISLPCGVRTSQTRAPLGPTECRLRVYRLSSFRILRRGR